MSFRVVRLTKNKLISGLLYIHFLQVNVKYFSYNSSIHFILQKVLLPLFADIDYIDEQR